MSAERFKDGLILGLLANLYDKDPVACERFLKRHQFRPGDVTFRKTKGSGRRRTWTTIHCWPWQRSSIALACGTQCSGDVYACPGCSQQACMLCGRRIDASHQRTRVVVSLPDAELLDCLVCDRALAGEDVLAP